MTAVKMLRQQIVRTRTLPLELRDVNGFTAQKAAELRLAQHEAHMSKKVLNSVLELFG